MCEDQTVAPWPLIVHLVERYVYGYIQMYIQDLITCNKITISRNQK